MWFGFVFLLMKLGGYGFFFVSVCKRCVVVIFLGIFICNFILYVVWEMESLIKIFNDIVVLC